MCRYNVLMGRFLSVIYIVSRREEALFAFTSAKLTQNKQPCESSTCAVFEGVDDASAEIADIGRKEEVREFTGGLLFRTWLLLLSARIEMMRRTFQPVGIRICI